MTHGDDDGLRCPPRIAPHQIVIVPMLRDNEEDAAILDYCRDLEASLKALDAFREPVRVLLDISGAKAQTKRSEEHTSELQSLMRISYAVFCLKKKITQEKHQLISLFLFTILYNYPI